MNADAREPGGISARETLGLIALSVGACLAGYFMAHLLLSEWFITLLSAGESDEFVRGTVGNLLLQLCCGAPLTVVLGPILAGMTILLDRLFKMSSTLRLTIALAASFFSGIVMYFPSQFLMLFGSAF